MSCPPRSKTYHRYIFNRTIKAQVRPPQGLIAVTDVLHNTEKILTTGSSMYTFMPVNPDEADTHGRLMERGCGHECPNPSRYRPSLFIWAHRSACPTTRPPPSDFVYLALSLLLSCAFGDVQKHQTGKTELLNMIPDTKQDDRLLRGAYQI